MRSVLVVDDSAAIRALIKSLIGEMGDFNIVEAASGFEALKELPREKFDLIVTDINMPDINGLELINFVKADQRYCGIPLIVVTTEKGNREKGLALGASGYLTKPFKAQEFQEVIEKILGL